MEKNTAYERIINLFFDYPEREFGFNEIVNLTKTSKITSNKILNSLIKEKFIKRKIIGKNWLISCNNLHEYNKTKKILYHLEKLYDSNIINKIKQTFPGYKSIILFGSYRKGDDTEKSDIDLAIEFSGDKAFKIEEFSAIKEAGYRKNIKVNLHLFSRDKINNNLFSNIANGIILEGFLEVKK